MCLYTTLWNIYAQKSTCFRTEWSELPCIRLSHLKQLLKIFIQWRWHRFVHWQNDISSGHTATSPPKCPTVGTPFNDQKERHLYKTPARTIKAKFHYAIWSQTGSKLVRSWSQTGSKPNSIALSGRRQVRSWFEAGRKQVRSWSRTC